MPKKANVIGRAGKTAGRSVFAFFGVLGSMDLCVFLTSVTMAIYGIVMIASAVRPTGGGSQILVQCVAALLGIGGMLVFSTLDYETLIQKLHIPIFLLTCGMLAATLVIGTGEGSNKSWIRFSFLPIGIQPSEFAKISFICTFGYHLSKVRDKLNRTFTVLGLCLHFGVIFGLVLLQGDLGSALVFLFIFICMLYAAGLRLRWFALAGVLGAAASPFLWDHLSGYQKQRILVGFSPESDPQGYGYQVLRAMEAIRNGGFSGMGYGKGLLTQSAAASALPQRHTDMIFAVLAEECGMLGVLCYLFLYTLLILRILRLSRLSRGYLGGYLCVGAAAVLIFQGLENMGMCMGLLPVIGLTLPFFSYGGSSLLSLFLLLGVVESVSSHRMKYFTERDAL